MRHVIVNVNGGGVYFLEERRFSNRSFIREKPMNYWVRDHIQTENFHSYLPLKIFSQGDIFEDIV